MVGAYGLGSKEDVRVCSLIVLAQFVWHVSSALLKDLAGPGWPSYLMRWIESRKACDQNPYEKHS